MKELEIDHEFSIKHDGLCWHLIKREIKTRDCDDKRGRWKKGDQYVSEGRTYFPTVKMALKSYLNESLSEANSIEDIVNKITEAENRIENLNIVIK